MANVVELVKEPPVVYGVNIIGVAGCSTPEDVQVWMTPQREKDLIHGLSGWLSDEGDRATMGETSAAWDGHWVFWHRNKRGRVVYP